MGGGLAAIEDIQLEIGRLSGRHRWQASSHKIKIKIKIKVKITIKIKIKIKIKRSQPSAAPTQDERKLGCSS
ncbi:MULTISPECIES: hypothetical protein [Pseudomonas]|uniref:hypothetical protein n=1 Tax=Pseudomonas TaxID=286 RepID=UPI0006422D4B|nr:MULTISPECIES: hypothetical protein [Pseudomonas]